MQRNRIMVGTIASLLVILAVAWAFGWLGGGVDPQVAAAQQARDELFGNRDEMTDAERREAFDQFRQQLDGLSDDQRREVFRGGRERFQEARRERLNEFFAMTPEEQNRELDRTIEQMRERRANRPQNGAGRGERGGRGGGRNRTDAQREERRKSRLDRSDPRLRAQRSEYRRRLNDRLAQRGMEPTRGGWRG